MKQQTIQQAVDVEGVGLHSGSKVLLSLHPAAENHGIVFQRVDLPNQPLIPANGNFVTDTMMSSNLVYEGAKVGTVEHLMSALSAMYIDNVLIKVSSHEIPIMDGSAKDFIKLISRAGIKQQTADKKYLKILKPVKIEIDDKWVELIPYDGFQLNFEINFANKVISDTPQQATLNFSSQTFIEEVCAAKTFCFYEEIEALKKNNLALGGGLHNAIVINENSIMNDEPLRYQDEFVKHKILDAIGDLYLIGYPILGQYNAYKSGHHMNNELIRKILSDDSNYEIVTEYV